MCRYWCLTYHDVEKLMLEKMLYLFRILLYGEHPLIFCHVTPTTRKSITIEEIQGV